MGAPLATTGPAAAGWEVVGAAATVKAVRVQGCKGVGVRAKEGMVAAETEAEATVVTQADRGKGARKERAQQWKEHDRSQAIGGSRECGARRRTTP